METAYNQIVSLIWNIADDVLRDVFLRGQYRDVILPMVVLRRIDALLEPTKVAVESKIKELENDGIEVEDGDLTEVTCLSYYNRSKWTLARLKSQAADSEAILYDNFVEYLNGFSPNVRDVLENFDYYNKAKKLADKHLLSLGAICDCSGLFRNPLGIMETDQLIRLYRTVLKYHDDFEDVLLFDAHV